MKRKEFLFAVLSNSGDILTSSKNETLKKFKLETEEKTSEMPIPIHNNGTIFRFLETIKQDTNAVGKCVSNNRQLLYKFCVIPMDHLLWEQSILEIIRDNIPQVPNFAKKFTKHVLPLRMLPSGRVKDEIVSLGSGLSANTNVMTQEFIIGRTFADEISNNDSFRDFFSTLYQVLAALAFAQEKIHLTHNDLHPSNIIIKRSKTQKIFLYDLPSFPLAVCSRGFSAKIIDFEYAYVDGLEGRSISCPFNLLNLGYDPSHHYSSVDPLRFIISANNWFLASHSQNHRVKLNVIRDIVQEISSKVNKQADFINDHGLLIDREKLFKIYLEKSKKSEIFHNEIQAHFYYLINILSSKMKMPLRNRFPSTSSLDLDHKAWIDLIEKLYECQFSHKEQILRLLYYLVNGEDVRALHFIREANIKLPTTPTIWITSLKREIDMSIPILETTLFHITSSLRSKRATNPFLFDYTPENMITFLNTKFDLHEPFTKDTQIVWISQRKRKRKLRLTLVPQETIDLLNKEVDMIKRSKFLLNLVQNIPE